MDALLFLIVCYGRCGLIESTTGSLLVSLVYLHKKHEAHRGTESALFLLLNNMSSANYGELEPASRCVRDVHAAASQAFVLTGKTHKGG